MRLVSVISIYFLVLNVFAEYTVFEKEGFYGIKDENGEVSVPAVYEYLGWTEGSSKIRSGVIGYKEGNLWGLITAKNKVVLEPKYHSLASFEEGLFKASIKGKFSNQLFYGILNAQGKTLVSFNYFSIETIGANLLVSSYESNQTRYGVISRSNQRLIPTNYSKIETEGSLIIAKASNGKADVFNSEGVLVSEGLSSVTKSEKGWVANRNGYRGFIDLGGAITYDFEYKDFYTEDDILYPVSFPKWGVYKEDKLIFEVNADSINYESGSSSQIYINGVHSIALVDSTIQVRNAVLKEASTHHYLFKNSGDDKWFALNSQGRRVLESCDSIIATDYVLWGRTNNSWHIYNRYGKKKSRFSYNFISHGVKDQFIVGISNNMGILDPLGNEITRIKFDAITKTSEYYKVKYLGRWGIMNPRGEWLLRPEYLEVFVSGNILVGKRGLGYTYYGANAEVTKTTFKPLETVGNLLIVADEEGALGLIDETASLKVYPEFDSIRYWNGYFELSKNGWVSLIDSAGNSLFGPEEGIQEVNGFSESYFLVKKNDRWGFLDEKGRLRISNRYIKARPFSEGLAGVKLRNKWGFINKDESLVVQPYYDNISPFNAGLSVASSNGLFGLINDRGEEIVKLKWKRIERAATGNYLVFDDRNKVGLISSSGSFLLRPSFEHLEDKDGKVIVTIENKKGVLDYGGNQLFKTSYKEIKISGDHTILKY